MLTKFINLANGWEGGNSNDFLNYCWWS